MTLVYGISKKRVTHSELQNLQWLQMHNSLKPGTESWCTRLSLGDKLWVSLYYHLESITCSFIALWYFHMLVYSVCMNRWSHQYCAGCYNLKTMMAIFEVSRFIIGVLSISWSWIFKLWVLIFCKMLLSHYRVIVITIWLNQVVMLTFITNGLAWIILQLTEVSNYFFTATSLADRTCIGGSFCGPGILLHNQR